MLSEIAPEEGFLCLFIVIIIAKNKESEEKMTKEEQKIADIQKMIPLNDVFFEALAAEPGVCEEILQTILQDDKLSVSDVIVQSSERNIYGRSVRLDALCTLGNGTKCNIEVQRSDNDDHFRRVRFNASSITVKSSDTGEKFKNVVELYVVYISEFDIINAGKTIYHVEKVVKETEQVIDDGLHEIYVNTAIDDGSDIAELMHCFTQETVNNVKFPNLCKAVHHLKSTKGGNKRRCKIMDKYLIESIIKTSQSFNASDEMIVAELMKQLEMSEEEAKKALDEFKAVSYA